MRTLAQVIIGVEEVGFGRTASAALARAVTTAKGGHPLAPVTVVVGSNFVGLSARWLLGSGALGLRGVANVSFVTPLRLAQLLGADQLAGRRALTNPVLGAAVRQALAADPGPYRQVAAHPATEAALVGLYREVANLDPATRAQVAAHDSGAAAALRLHLAVSSRLGAFHDEAELTRAAAERPGLGLALETFGQFIWYLPTALPGPMAHLLSILFGVAPTRVIVGLVGQPDADEAVRRSVRLAGVGPASPVASSGGPPQPPCAGQVVSVSDPDEEVRWVTRRILALVAEGLAAERIAVFYPVAQPYLALLSQHLSAAAIPANGPAPRPLSDSVAGRTLLGALALPSQQWRRDRVMALISGAPLRHEGEPVPAVTWDRHSRDAGVVAGLADWAAKLARHGDLLQEPAGAGRRGSDQGVRDSLAALSAFVVRLAALVEHVTTATSWAGKSRAAGRLLEVLLGGERARVGWPVGEGDAADALQETLVRLAELDPVDPRPSAESFLQALTNELDRTVGRQGRFGHGVLFGPLSTAVGLDLDAVFLLGCIEGLCPAPRRLDSLLSEGARAVAAGELARADDRRFDQQRAWLAAVSAAPPGRATALVPRGDLRQGRRTLPSRFVLEGLSSAEGRSVSATSFERLGPPTVEVVPSYRFGLLGAVQHATVGDRDLCELHAAVDGDAALHTHPLATLTGAGFLAQQQRAGSAFSAFDGNLAGQPLAALTARAPMAATRLETFAQCGFRYLLSHVLGVGERDDPERVVTLSALDRGAVLHQVLEQFLTEAIGQGVPSPHQRWSDAQRERLVEIAQDCFDELERRGRSGRAISWQLERHRLLGHLSRFLDHDDAYRAERSARPEHAEMAFGMDEAAEVPLLLPDGRTLAVRGRADRADRTAGGGAVVIDYKSGRGQAYAKLSGTSGETAFHGGTALQLGVYAEAARELLQTEQVEAYYWLLEAPGTSVLRGYRWTGELRQQFLGLVASLVAGIEGGSFPMVPGSWEAFSSTHQNCRYCEFDRLCPSDRGARSEVKLADPQLRARMALVSAGGGDGPAEAVAQG